MERIWLDTNVVLRFLTREPEEHFSRALSLLARTDAGELELYLDDMILAELVWTLESFFDLSTERIADVLVEFLAMPGVVTRNKKLSIRALRLMTEKNVDFVDAFFALRAAAAGEEVKTFDKTDFARLPVQWSEPS